MNFSISKNTLFHPLYPVPQSYFASSSVKNPENDSIGFNVLETEPQKPNKESYPIITNQTDKGTRFIWKASLSQTAQQIRSLIMSTFTPEKQLIKRFAFDISANIAVVDISSKQWNDFIPALINATNDPDLANQEALAIVLQYICNEFNEFQVRMSDIQIKQISIAILLRIGDTQLFPQRASLLALSTFLSWMNDFLEIQHFRQILTTALLKCLAVSDLIQPTLDVFSIYTKKYYKYLGEIGKSLYNITKPIIISCSKDSVAAIQFWRVVAEQYLIRKHFKKTENSFQTFEEQIIQLLVTCLLQFSINPQDIENEVRQAAFQSLLAICQNCEQNSIKSIFHFIANAFHSPEWRFKQATMLALAAIGRCENELMKNGFAKSLDQFFGLLEDKNDLVVESSIIGFAKLLEKKDFSRLILQRINCDQYISAFMNLLIKQKKIVYPALQALKNLTNALTGFDCKLAENPTRFLKIMFRFISPPSTPDEKELVLVSSIIQNLLLGNQSFVLDRDYLKYILGVLENLRGDISDLKLEYLQILWAAIIVRNNPLQRNIFDRICSVIRTHLHTVRTVDWDGMFLIEALALRCREEHYPKFEQLIPYINNGLSIENQSNLYLCSMSTICTILTNFDCSMTYLGERYLIMFLNDFHHTEDQVIKIGLLQGIAKIIQNNETLQLFYKYQSEIIQIVQLNVSSLILFYYAENYCKLKDIIIEFFNYLSNLLKTNIPAVFSLLQIAQQFVRTICTEQLTPRQSDIENGLTLILEMSSTILDGEDNHYKNLVKTLLSNSEFVNTFHMIYEIPQNYSLQRLSESGRNIFGILNIEGYRYI